MGEVPFHFDETYYAKFMEEFKKWILYRDSLEEKALQKKNGSQEKDKIHRDTLSALFYWKGRLESIEQKRDIQKISTRSSRDDPNKQLLAPIFFQKTDYKRIFLAVNEKEKYSEVGVMDETEKIYQSIIIKEDSVSFINYQSDEMEGGKAIVEINKDAIIFRYEYSYSPNAKNPEEVRLNRVKGNLFSYESKTRKKTYFFEFKENPFLSFHHPFQFKALENGRNDTIYHWDELGFQFAGPLLSQEKVFGLTRAFEDCPKTHFVYGSFDSDGKLLNKPCFKFSDSSPKLYMNLADGSNILFVYTKFGTIFQFERNDAVPTPKEKLWENKI